MTLQYLCTIMIDYKKELNDSQYQAVTYCEGPSLVIAGAGSGKTRVLTYKIAYLLENGYRPWNILALTFTNKAAREMKNRIVDMLVKEYGNELRFTPATDYLRYNGQFWEESWESAVGAAEEGMQDC